MWTIKYFRHSEAQESWIARNQHRYQIIRLFVNNGYAVEFKPMRRVY